MKLEDYFLYGFFSDKGISLLLVLLILTMVFVALRIENPAFYCLIALALYIVAVVLWLISFVFVSQFYSLFSLGDI